MFSTLRANQTYLNSAEYRTEHSWHAACFHNETCDSDHNFIKTLIYEPGYTAPILFNPQKTQILSFASKNTKKEGEILYPPFMLIIKTC